MNAINLELNGIVIGWTLQYILKCSVLLYHVHRIFDWHRFFDYFAYCFNL